MTDGAENDIEMEAKSSIEVKEELKNEIVILKRKKNVKKQKKNKRN